MEARIMAEEPYLEIETVAFFGQRKGFARTGATNPEMQVTANISETTIAVPHVRFSSRKWQCYVRCRGAKRFLEGS